MRFVAHTTVMVTSSVCLTGSCCADRPRCELNPNVLRVPIIPGERQKWRLAVIIAAMQRKVP